MKLLIGMAFAVVLAFSTLGISPRAQAGGPAITTAITDCTNGCTIVTCEASTCWVWRCDSNGCRIIGSYRNPRQQSQRNVDAVIIGQPEAFDKVCEAAARNVCAIKVCSGATCRISAFDGKQFVPVGNVDNVDYLLQQTLPRLRK